MAENRINAGRLVLLEGATAFSNIAAGMMVATCSDTNAIYSYSRETTGLTTGGSMGVRFLGVLDQDVSAGQITFPIWTEGVFRFQLEPLSTAVVTVGTPVFVATSGGGQMVIAGSGPAAPLVSGTLALGTVVSLGGSGTAGNWLDVKINPGAFLWGGAAMAASTGHGNNFPPQL